MKRFVLIVIILVILTAPAFTIGMESLYDMVVPMSRDELVLSGELNSDDVIDISIPVGGAFSADIGAEGDYFMIDQTEESTITLGINASFELGSTTSLFVGTNQTNSIRQYGLDINGMEGFWALQGTGRVRVSSNSGLDIILSPQAGLGIGREYAIFNILRAELMMKYLGVVPTVQKVQAVAEVFDRAGVFLSQYSDNDADLVKAYWQDIANAMGIPGRVVDIIVLANSQEYAFELNRYNGFMHGMEFMIYLGFEPELRTSVVPPFSIDAAELGLDGSISGFLVDNMLYYRAQGLLAETLQNGSFTTSLTLLGDAVYLPEDYRWWAEAGVLVGLTINNATTFQVDISGELNYMLTPNFTTYAQIELSTLGGIDINAGGRYRLW